MNPIKNQKNLETKINEIQNYAYSYLEKYSPSKQQLRIYLYKKQIKRNHNIGNKKEIFDLIDIVISTLINQNIFRELSMH